MKRAKTIALWALQIIFALLMITAGYSKFTVDRWPGDFEQWGYPDGFVYVIGVLEIVGGIGLLIPRITFYAAALLCIIMIGATITRIIDSTNTVALIVHVVYILAYAFIAYVRRP